MTQGLPCFARLNYLKYSLRGGGQLIIASVIAAGERSSLANPLVLRGFDFIPQRSGLISRAPRQGALKTYWSK